MSSAVWHCVRRVADRCFDKNFASARHSYRLARKYSAVGRQRSTWNLFLDKNISTFHTYSINRADGHFNLRHIKNLILIPKQDIGLLRKKNIRFIIDATARLSNATDWVPSCKPDFQYTWGCYCFSVYVTITNKYYLFHLYNRWVIILPNS